MRMPSRRYHLLGSSKDGARKAIERSSIEERRPSQKAATWARYRPKRRGQSRRPRRHRAAFGHLHGGSRDASGPLAGTPLASACVPEAQPELVLIEHVEVRTHDVRGHAACADADKL